MNTIIEIKEEKDTSKIKIVLSELPALTNQENHTSALLCLHGSCYVKWQLIYYNKQLIGCASFEYSPRTGVIFCSPLYLFERNSILVSKIEDERIRVLINSGARWIYRFGNYISSSNSNTFEINELSTSELSFVLTRSKGKFVRKNWLEWSNNRIVHKYAEVKNDIIKSGFIDHKVSFVTETNIKRIAKYLKKNHLTETYFNSDHQASLVLPKNEWFIATKNKKIIAVSSAKINKTFQVVSLGRLFVEKNERQKGIGKRLIEQRLIWAKQNGVKKAITAIDMNNEISLNLMCNLGFKKSIVLDNHLLDNSHLFVLIKNLD